MMELMIHWKLFGQWGHWMMEPMIHRKPFGQWGHWMVVLETHWKLFGSWNGACFFVRMIAPRMLTWVEFGRLVVNLEPVFL